MKSLYQFLIFLALVTLSSSAIASKALINKNPFVPSQSQIAPAKKPQKTSSKPVPPDRFKFQGVLRLGNKFEFSIVDTKTKTSRWVSAGESENGFRIVSYHPGMKELSFEWNGRRGRLKLKTADPLPLSVVRSINEATTKAESAPEQGSAMSTAQGRTLSASQERALAMTGGAPPKVRSISPPGPIRFSAVASGSSSPAFFEDTSNFAQADLENASTKTGSNESRQRNPRSIFPRNNVHNPNGKIPQG